MPFYNLMYGPPVFAPLLFAAAGFLGLLASLLRRETSRDNDAHDARSGRDGRPVDPKTGRHIGPLEQPGYYPGYSTLREQAFWDDATRKEVFERIHEVPPIGSSTTPRRGYGSDRRSLIPQHDRARTGASQSSDRGRAAPRGPARRLPLRGHAARPRGLPPRAREESTTSPGASTGDRSWRLAGGNRKRSSSRSTTRSRQPRTTSGRECRCGATGCCCCRTRSRPTTRTRGAGTKSDSAGRPTRAATCACRAAGRSRGRRPSTDTSGRRRGLGVGRLRGGAPGRALRAAGAGGDALREPLLGPFNPPEGDEHWLGPNQRLPGPMRRLRAGRGSRLVIVGVGAAGGVLLQRLSRAGFRSSASRPGHSGTPSATGSATRQVHIISTGTTCESPAARTPCRSARTTAARASAAGPSIGRLRAALPPLGFPDSQRDGVGVDWPISYQELKPVLRADGARDSGLGARPTSPGATRTATPTVRTRWARRRRAGEAAARGSASAFARAGRWHHRRVARAAGALHLSRLLHPGLQGGAKQSTLVSHVPDAMRARRGDP